MASRPSPSQVGARAELAVATALIRAGDSVYLPLFNGHGRVDLIRQPPSGELYRVQCKSARFLKGVVVFATCSHTGGGSQTYAGDVDEFGVYVPDLDRVYLVPVSDVPGGYGYLRVEPTLNNQVSGIRWADAYLVS